MSVRRERPPGGRSLTVAEHRRHAVGLISQACSIGPTRSPPCSFAVVVAHCTGHALLLQKIPAPFVNLHSIGGRLPPCAAPLYAPAAPAAARVRPDPRSDKRKMALIAQNFGSVRLRTRLLAPFGAYFAGGGRLARDKSRDNKKSALEKAEGLNMVSINSRMPNGGDVIA